MVARWERGWGMSEKVKEMKFTFPDIKAAAGMPSTAQGTERVMATYGVRWVSASQVRKCLITTPYALP